MKENLPFVSIIIVNFNGKSYLKRCLESLSKINYKNFEIIVIDNNSIDGSIEYIENNYPKIKIKKLDKNYGFAYPNNIGVENSKGEFIIFLNNDTIVDPNFISEMIKVLQKDSEIAICQSLLLKKDGAVDSSGDFIDNLGRAYSNHQVPTEVSYILSPKAASMIIRKKIFLDLEGFDEDYFASFEDVELGWKSWLWGYKSVIVPSSIVYHYRGKTVRTISDEIAFHGVKNSISLRMTHFDFIDSVYSVTLMMLLVFSQKLFKINFAYNKNLENNTPNLKIIVKGFFWILTNLHHIYKKRKKIKSRTIVKNSLLKNNGLIASSSS